jgi:hypothetical protein
MISGKVDAMPSFEADRIQRQSDFSTTVWKALTYQIQYDADSLMLWFVGLFCRFRPCLVKAEANIWRDLLLRSAVLPIFGGSGIA